MIRIVPFLLLLCALPLRAQPIWWSSNEVVSTSMAANRPRIAVNGYQNPVVIWGEGPNLISGMADTWGFNRTDTLNLPGQPISISFWHGPEIAGRGDTLYVVYKEDPEADTSHHIYCVASFDGGLHFQEPNRVDHIGMHMGRLPTIAVGPGGQPVVAFMKSGLNYSDPQWVVASSSDYGQTFGLAVQVSGDNGPGSEACDCCPASLTVSGGMVYLAYRDNLSDVRNIRVAAGPWLGSAYASISVDPQTWVVNSCPASGPDLVGMGDSLYSTFLNGAQQDAVMLSRWHVSDTLAQVAPMSPSTVAQNYPRIDAQLWSTGDISRGMVWKSGAGTQAKIAAKIEHLGQTVWMELDTGTVNVPDVAISGQGAYFVWHEVLQKRIYLKRGLFQPIGIEEPVSTENTRTLVHVVDLYGRTVAPGQEASGIYVHWFSDGSYERVFVP
ncbi:MAG TPA: hypothetical protein DCE13_03745 [Cryomorphaceae bacterium]|jgi:hypothetical protein|nr:MAG: hypothetical protein ABR98_06850 [Cryomorphaceae bacterium BACL7 MAG-120910-bin2]KRO81907.1 MAG: hypothetical protein ABR87_00575 [Cryomorphaceae bacterium BACL7 MAG-121220-bin83]HAB31637.1 hypothetical protein [Cryomorphaceae bacterium]